MDGRTQRSTLYLRPRNERLERSEGPVLVPDEPAVELTGIAEVLPREQFAQALVQLAQGPRVVYLPFRLEALGAAEQRVGNNHVAAAAADPWDGRPSREAVFIEKIRAQLPGVEIGKLDPILDELRMVKTRARSRWYAKPPGLPARPSPRRCARPARECTSTSWKPSATTSSRRNSKFKDAAQRFIEDYRSGSRSNRLGHWVGMEPAGGGGEIGLRLDRGAFRAQRVSRPAAGAGGPQTLWLRLSERDEVDQSRSNKAVSLARRYANPWGAQPSEDGWRVEMIRRNYPYYELRDLCPDMDRLRVIKTPREIEILKRNGKLSAEAIVRAIRATAPGRHEYELEAEATYHLFRHGVQGNGYPAIVGSGPNVNVWHYQNNGRQMNPGELIVMDYGGSLDYLVIDITRSWPVSGKFDDLQLRAYRCALEAQKAIIEAMRPGAPPGPRPRRSVRHFTRSTVSRINDRRAPVTSWGCRSTTWGTPPRPSLPEW
jgi:Xaa-Pro aminopeptidase